MTGSTASSSCNIVHFVARRTWLLAMVTTLSYFGSSFWVLDLFAHFRWQYAFAFSLTFVAAIYARLHLCATFALLGMLTQFGHILSLPLQQSNALPLAANAREVSVLFANCAMSTHAEKLIAEINARQPDIVGIAELSNELSRSLLAKFADQYRVHAMFPDTGWQGIGVLVRNGIFAHAKAELVAEKLQAFPTARLSFGGGELLVVHPIPPVSSQAAAARDQFFAALAEYSQSRSDLHTLIITGDFNASTWSAPFQSMQLNGQLRDSAEGFWPLPTWHGPNILFAPLSIPIDQLLLRGPLQVSAREVLSNPDSDHGILWLRLRIAVLPSAKLAIGSRD
jgi:endonuclease/exonuclease/phosphatase (EEP) superfamily protein YafD